MKPELLKGKIRMFTEHTTVWEFPDQPGVFDVRTNDDHFKLIARGTPYGLRFWCRRCKEEHLLGWWDNEEYIEAQRLLRSGPGAPEWYKILCVDGHVRIAFPGERLGGKQVTLLQQVTRTLTSD